MVEAGVTLADVQAAALQNDRYFPLSLASEGTARIGGNLSTNAGGVQVLRYGNARDLCLGLEAVLPSGEIWHGLKRLRKDTRGGEEEEANPAMTPLARVPHPYGVLPTVVHRLL